MESSSRRSLHAQKSASDRQKLGYKKIELAIRGKSCPICLTHIEHRRAAVIIVCLHAYCVDCIQKWSDLKRKCPLCNLDFDSLFFKIDLYSRTFLEEKLPGLSGSWKVNSEGLRRRRIHRIAEQRFIRRSREEFNCFSVQTRPLPRQRWFGRPESNSPNAVAQRVLQWRASIYDQHLKAVPFNEQNQIRNNGPKERIENKIEPWIRRELEAILGDPDPTVIVHVASSLFISILEEKRAVSFKESDLEDTYLEPLRPFLQQRTNMFWHELRCFAESSFNMETYDTIVEYRKWSD